MYYAKQVNPEFAESWLFYDYCNKNTGKRIVGFEDEVYEENVIINGNNDFVNIYPEKLDNLQKNIEYFNSDLQGWYGEQGNLTELANCYFKKHNGKRWSKKELHQWRIVSNLTENYSKDNKEEAFLKALKLITGKEWRKFVICGCSQGDWNYGYASEEVKDNDIHYIELCYFNTGEEYLLYASEEDMENDNSCTSYYVDSWKAKDRLCEHIGCKPEELIVYEFDGYQKIPQYKIAQ